MRTTGWHGRRRAVRDRRHRGPGRDVRPGAGRRPRRHGELVALADPNPARMAAHNRWLAELGAPPVPTYAAADVAAMLDKERVDALRGVPPWTPPTTSTSSPRCEAGLRRDHREADDHRRAALPAHPRRGRSAPAGGSRSPSTTATTRCTRRSASCSPTARSARSARCTSSGCSTCGTAPTTSAAGTATRPTPAACWCTRRATTSTWSTGGSAPTPVEVYAAGPAVLLRRGRRAGTATPATTTGRTARRPPQDDPFALHLAGQPAAARALPRRRGRRRLPARPQRLRARRRPSRTTWRCWSATPPAPR